MNNTASTAMPDLPGYYYDASRNRYFKGERPRTPSPPPAQRKRVVNITRLLCHEYEYGTTWSRTHITAHILSSHPHISRVNKHHLAIIEDEQDLTLNAFHAQTQQNLPFTIAIGELMNWQVHNGPNVAPVPPLEVPALSVLRSAIAVNDGRGKVRLHAFPHGEVLNSTFCDAPPVSSKWCSKNMLLVYAIHGGATEEVVWLPIPPSSRVYPRHCFRLMEAVNEIDISDGGLVVLGCSFTRHGRERGKVYVLDRRRTLFKSYLLGSAVLSVKFIDQDRIVAGTRSGVVQVMNFKEEAPIPLRVPSKEEKVPLAVCCLRVEGRKVYVSSMGNGESNLSCYDIDMAGGEPNVCYLEHTNAAKRLEFDIGGDILAAGGDDGVVRFWDKHRGGYPLGTRVFRNEEPNIVRFVGYEDDGTENETGTGSTTGFWVVTEKNIYSYLV